MAILKRCTVVLNTKDFVYVRIAGVNSKVTREPFEGHYITPDAGVRLDACSASRLAAWYTPGVGACRARTTHASAGPPSAVLLQAETSLMYSESDF